jgi:23S rRNA pseudouridine1911/1915/1917 synthase
MADRSEKFVIEHSQPGLRFDRFLAERYPVVSRGTLQRLIEEGHITVNGRPVKATHTPRSGDEVSVTWPDVRPPEARPEEIPLDVLFEDDDLLVLNKAPGIVVHPAAGHEAHTLVNALLHHCAGQLSGIGGVARPGIVHRLDKDTSGCLVVAKNDATHLALSAQFAARTTQKLYLAVLCGELARDSGEIHAAISRHPSHRKRMAISASAREGRAAHTSYRVLERLPHATLAEATLKTGRTHQLRVHFHHIGFPIAGDEVYGERPTRRLEEATGCPMPRVMLHAWKLAFEHPTTKRRRSFTAPIPDDFQNVVDRLKAQS